MLNKNLGFLMIFFVISCANNNVLLDYTVNGKKAVVTVKEADKAFADLLTRYSPDQLQQVVQDVSVFQDVILETAVEPKLFLQEALSISNFTNDVIYKSEVEQQEKMTKYQIAQQKGYEMITNEVTKGSVEVAEVSRILFTNDNPQITTDEIITRISNSEDPINEFALLAEEYSQELVAADGGYLGQVFKNQYPEIDEAVFSTKKGGLISEVVVDNNNKYIVYINTPAKKIKVKNLIAKNPNALGALTTSYIDSKIQMLITSEIDDNSNIVYITKGKEYTVEQLTDNIPVMKVWGKTHNIGELTRLLNDFSGNQGPPFTAGSLLSFLLDPRQQVKSGMAVIFKGLSPSIVKSKEYKTLVADAIQNIEFRNVRTILSPIIFTNLSTNVTQAEIDAIYNNTATRPVVGQNPDGSPLYITKAEFDKYKQQISDDIINTRRYDKLAEYRKIMNEKYGVTWNEKRLEKLFKNSQEAFADFVKENPNTTMALPQ